MVNLYKDLQSDRRLQALLEYSLLSGSKLPQGIPKTKLFKLIYLIEYATYYYTGKSVSGKEYKNRKYGLVPDALFALVDEMVEIGKIKISDGERAKFHKLIAQPQYISLLTDKERKIAKAVCDYWRDKKTEQVVDFTHSQRPWFLTKKNEIVPYELILQEDNPYKSLNR